MPKFGVHGVPVGVGGFVMCCVLWWVCGLSMFSGWFLYVLLGCCGDMLVCEWRLGFVLSCMFVVLVVLFGMR